jgi:ABC-type histidine transport system ATPase subunit
VSAGSNGTAALRIEGLHKWFGGHEVLRGIDLEVDNGNVVVIFGRSGSGKSTLLRCVNFLEEPTEGTIRLPIRVGWTSHPSQVSRSASSASDGDGLPGVQPFPI